MYLVGEALVGEGAELAHVDVIVGDLDGVAGSSLARGVVRGRMGHTPLPGVIRPNLLVKPFTLIVPKVDLKGFSDVGRVFGPVQYAVAKAVADAVEEGLIPGGDLDRLAVICGVYVDPRAEDVNRLFHYNYSAVKLALKRAISQYPSVGKLFSEKDRSRHPLSKFRAPRLWMPPYLQVALDNPDMEYIKQVVSQLPRSDRIILEAGTPLIKQNGLDSVRELRSMAGDNFLIADLKTLDTGRVEVDEAMEAGADGVVVSGLAPKDVIEEFIYEAERIGVYPILDMTDIPDPVKLLGDLKVLPRVAILHRGIDQEASTRIRWELIGDLKARFSRVLVAVAGGITPESIPTALESGVDILIVGRYITQARDPRRAALEFLRRIGLDMDQLRVHVE
ncbi:MAG: bifunctional 5,6,7,8-tetrahydromethanopterin hydro-lyase/3-hexulose-6-phosphate synthase [Candidatus Bathyarchaeia archaeon]